MLRRRTRLVQSQPLLRPDPRQEPAMDHNSKELAMCTKAIGIRVCQRKVLTWCRSLPKKSQASQEHRSLPSHLDEALERGRSALLNCFRVLCHRAQETLLQN